MLIQKKLTVNKPPRKRIHARREALEQDRIRHSYEIKLIRQLTNIFYEYGRRAANEYTFHQKTVESDEYISKKLYTTLIGHMRVVYFRFARRQMDAQTKQDDEKTFEEMFHTYIAMEAGNNIKLIEKTTKKLVREAILYELANDGNLSTIAQAIRKINGLDGNSIAAVRRARTIARTETAAAAANANWSVAEHMGVAMDKIWKSVSDSRVRTDHFHMNNVKVGMDEVFLVGDPAESMKRPMDPNASAKQVINCRCVCLFKRKDDVLV